MLFTLAAVAIAHVGIEDPPPRYPSDGYYNNKACPCGVGTNDSLCSDTSNQSDPNRSTTVTVYNAGETITISAHEVIGHSGRWRVAFDSDGADLADFNANILLDVEDPPGSDGNVGQGDLWEFVVTLPNISCDNCTLQLLQIMNGNTTDPVPDPTGQSTYYQCADIELIGGASTGDTGTQTGGTDTASTINTDTTDTASTTDPGPDTTDPDTTDPDTTPPTATGPTNDTATPPENGTPPAASEQKAAGCGCNSTLPPGALWLLVLPLLARRSSAAV